MDKDRVEQVVKAVLEMDPEDRAIALKHLNMYASGRILIRTNAEGRRLLYNMETGMITICTADPGDTAGIMAGFLEIEKRHWLDDLAT